MSMHHLCVRLCHPQSITNRKLYLNGLCVFLSVSGILCDDKPPPPPRYMHRLRGKIPFFNTHGMTKCPLLQHGPTNHPYISIYCVGLCTFLTDSRIMLVCGIWTTIFPECRIWTPIFPECRIWTPIFPECRIWTPIFSWM